MLSACGPATTTSTTDRVVFLDVDNLTGEDSLAWVAKAVPVMAAQQLAGVGKIVPLRGSTSREAVALRADRLVHGYFDRRRGKLHFEFSIEDSSTHTMQPVSVEGEVFDASTAVAKAVDAGAHRFSSTHSGAIRAWTEGNLEAAVNLDPNFATVLRELAQDRSNKRRFAEAIQLYGRALQNEPEEPTQYNGLGYAQFFAGDLAGARKSFDRYMKFPGHEANALDSQGEILFMAGQFKDAEQYFMKAHNQSPALLNGGDLLKAAYARWLGGDLAGADAIFKSYLDYRARNGDKALDGRKAVWEYSTGRPVESIARLRPNLPEDLAALERQYLQTPPAADGFIRTVYARALIKAGKSAEAAKLIQLWPLPESGDSLPHAFLYPWFLELKNSK